ncbi:hypothetical protein I9Y33_001476 [Clostridium perfringens]|nr:hypothetical protein [Clostridium perfringens]EGT0013613.1 hypothetical protein [Clostridium perfringens]
MNSTKKSNILIIGNKIIFLDKVKNKLKETIIFSDPKGENAFNSAI